MDNSEDNMSAANQRVQSMEAEYQSLLERSQRLQLLLDNNFDGVFVHQNFRVLEANRKLERMFKLPPGGLIGFNIFDMLTEDSQKRVLGYVERRTPEVLPVDFIRSDGTLLRTEVIGTPCSFNGLPARIVAVTDIEDRLHYQQEARQAWVEATSALAAAVEISDPYTSGHMSRVAEISIKIGRCLGFSARQLEGLHLGATIHDIGKISIPSSLLNKPGRLDDIEMKLVQQHALRGAEVVQEVDFPWPIFEMVSQHHERLDGSGYPKGLKGDDICGEALVIGVADVYEAMTSHRPYRPALPQELALNELRDGRGSRYSEKVVDALLGLVSEGAVS